MATNIDETVLSYLRLASENRYWLAALCLVISIATLTAATFWPKTYTASSSIFADNSNILGPLMAGRAVTTEIVDQARMAQDILFSREYRDIILEASGADPARMTEPQKEQMIAGIQGRTTIENQGRGRANLIVISHTDEDPVRAFRVTQRYTTLFIEQSAISKQAESRAAFEFIEDQVASYQAKLQDSENRLSQFKTANNFGTLANANNRIAGYQAGIENIDIALTQLDSQIVSVRAQLEGEAEVSRDISEVNAIRSRINSLQLQLDTLRARYHDTYPDVVQVKNQIADLQEMLDSGRVGTTTLGSGFDVGVTTLHQELRSRLAALITERESQLTQRNGIVSLLLAEEERARRINESEAELAELTRDYNVTQDFYNNLLLRLENARVSMHLDEQQQGITFKIQESAVIPTQPDGYGFSQLMMGSLVLSLGAPFGLIFMMLQLDPRVRSENTGWSDDWPLLIGTVPQYYGKRSILRSNGVYVSIFTLLLVFTYGAFWYWNNVG